MKITAMATFDRKTLSDLYAFRFFATKDPKNKILRYWLLTIVITAFFGYKMISDDISVLSLVIYILLLCILWVLYGWLTFLYYCLPKIKDNPKNKNYGVVNSYLFEDDHFTVTSSKENKSLTISYDCISKIHHTKDYFFIVCSVNNKFAWFAVDLSTVKNGTINDLKEFLGNTKNINCISYEF